MTERVLDHPQTVFTIGHSTRELAEFIHLLKTYGVTKIADVRTVPRSRHNPQFNRETLPDALKAASIGLSTFRDSVVYATPASIRAIWLGATRRSAASRTTCRPMSLRKTWSG